ncbi:hypothetical protein BKA00_006423 [Actinomadura coerulea]|uniref:Uncharacterized protein n=1 Tax=Actinomadura coerulea TaxID=46159 RepID=A0A7X0G5D4_9ACTN|nr:hypothetical protein [Actinomadura coerulea]MBB6399509.1 hypothetical protein [Actinomadura coerulea]GGQ13221.1 hypothetical protein GCM10010187_31950 [Actinomadura coerulea]
MAAAIGKAVERFEAHANYKRRGAHDDEERLDFVLHANGDTDREIAWLSCRSRSRATPPAASRAEPTGKLAAAPGS